MKYKDVLQMAKTADASRNSAVQRYRQGLAAGNVQPAYSQGDFGRVRSAAQQAWDDNADIRSDMANGLRAGVRGMLKPVARGIQYSTDLTGNLLHGAHAVYDATVNRNDAAYHGQSLPQRLDTAMARTKNGWTSKLNNWADDYGRYMEEGMNAVPGLAYTNDFETRHPGLRATGERTGTVIGGLGISALAGAVAIPATAPAWIGKAMSYMPGAANKAVTTGISTVSKLPWYWRDLGTRAVQSLPGMPAWAQAAMGYGNLAYGYATDAAQGMKAAGDQGMLPGSTPQPGAVAQAGRGAVPQRPPGI